MLTHRQRDCLAVIDTANATTGVSPSFEEMRAALGLRSKANVARLVDALVERGFVRRFPGRARGLEVIRLPGDLQGELLAAARQVVAHEAACLGPDEFWAAFDVLKRAVARADGEPF